MNYKLTLCYDGTRYRGWQRQGNTENTIQARVEAALSGILGDKTEIAGSGRTDAGVHAREQVCSFRTSVSLDCGRVLALLRSELPEDIGAVSLEPADDRFHARLSVREKTYRYRILNSDRPEVFTRRYYCRFPQLLDIDAMREAASHLCGEHDFTSFCSALGKKRSPVRSLKSIRIVSDGDMLDIFLTADGFLYNMVRIITGTLLEVGTGQRNADSILQTLEEKNRSAAGFTAPAQGLMLWEVKY